MFLTGTDEHGLKIEQKAAEKGVTPKEYVDKIVETFKKLWSYMNINYDRYIRTTDDYHIETVRKIFKALYDKGYIYKGKYTGKYCTPVKASGQTASLLTANVLIAEEILLKHQKKLISLKWHRLQKELKSF